MAPGRWRIRSRRSWCARRTRRRSRRSTSSRSRASQPCAGSRSCRRTCAGAASRRASSTRTSRRAPTATTRSSTSPASTGARATSSWPGTRTWARPSGWPRSRRRPACGRSRPGLTPDAYDEGWTFHSGVLELAFIHSWIAGIFGPQDRLWLDDVERSYAARDELIEFAPWCEPWFREAIGSPYWERCSIAARRDAVRVPALSIGGWHDTFLDGTLRNFAADRNPRSRLIIGPWGHDDWLTHLVGDRNLGVAGSGDAFGLFDRELEFYSAAIAGEDPPMARVSAYMLGARRWLELESWPPPGCRAGLDADPRDGVRSRPREPAAQPRRADPQGQHGGRPRLGPVRPAPRGRPSWCLARGARRAPGAPAGGPGARPPGDRIDRRSIRPTGSAPSACATATARFSTCARGSRGPRRARPRSRSTSGTSASSCPPGAELCLLVAGASYPRWEPLGEPRRQTVGAGSTLDLTAAGDV